MTYHKTVAKAPKDDSKRCIVLDVVDGTYIDDGNLDAPFPRIFSSVKEVQDHVEDCYSEDAVTDFVIVEIGDAFKFQIQKKIELNLVKV